MVHSKEDRKRIAELVEQVKSYEQELRRILYTGLEQAKKCGDALRQLQPFFPRKWKQEVRKRFKGVFSYETAAHYITVSKHWNDPCILEYRKQKNVSIEGFLAVLKYRPPENIFVEEKTDLEQWRSCRIKDIYEEYSKGLLRMIQGMSEKELWVHYEFGRLCNDGLWNNYTEARKTLVRTIFTQENIGFDPYAEYEDLTEEEKAKVKKFGEDRRREWLIFKFVCKHGVLRTGENIAELPEFKAYEKELEQKAEAKREAERVHDAEWEKKFRNENPDFEEECQKNRAYLKSLEAKEHKTSHYNQQTVCAA